MVVCGISTVIFNANPLLRFDGYYALADWLEIPNLRERSDRFLRQRAMATCLGIDVTPEPAPGVRRGSLFVAYAIASYLYRWLVMIGVIWLLYRFLKPYHLGAVGAMLAAAALISMVGRPIFRAFNSWSRWKKLPTMKPTRIAASGVLLAAAAAAFFECPLPWSPVRGVGLVQWQPDAVERIYLPASAALQRVYVHDGQEVRSRALRWQTFAAWTWKAVWKKLGASTRFELPKRGLLVRKRAETKTASNGPISMPHA